MSFCFPKCLRQTELRLNTVVSILPCSCVTSFKTRAVVNCVNIKFHDKVLQIIIYFLSSHFNQTSLSITASFGFNINTGIITLRQHKYFVS